MNEEDPRGLIAVIPPREWTPMRTPYQRPGLGNLWAGSEDERDASLKHQGGPVVLKVMMQCRRRRIERRHRPLDDRERTGSGAVRRQQVAHTSSHDRDLAAPAGWDDSGSIRRQGVEASRRGPSGPGAHTAFSADLTSVAWTTSTAVDDAMPSGLHFIPKSARRSTLTSPSRVT